MGNSFSWVAPATGRLMFSNCPPLGASQVHTLGGVYVDLPQRILVIVVHKRVGILTPLSWLICRSADILSIKLLSVSANQALLRLDNVSTLDTLQYRCIATQ